MTKNILDHEFAYVINGTINPYSLSTVIIVSTFSIATIIFSIFLIFTILGPGKIPKAIRIVLINILIAVIASAIVGLAAAVLYCTWLDCFRDYYMAYKKFFPKFIYFYENVLLPYCGTHNITFCYFNSNTSHLNLSLFMEFQDILAHGKKCVDLWILHEGSFWGLCLYGLSTLVSVRALFMAYYAIVVYVFITSIQYKIKIWAVMLGCVGLWIFAITVNIGSLILLIENLEKLSRFSVNGDRDMILSSGSEMYALIVPSIIEIVACIVSAVFPILALLSLRRRTGKVVKLNDVGYARATAKLALFLMTGNALSFVGHLTVIVPSLVYWYEAVIKNNVYNPELLGIAYTAFILGLIIDVASLLITPILFTIFLRQIRQNAKKIFRYLLAKVSLMNTIISTRISLKSIESTQSDGEEIRLKYVTKSTDSEDKKTTEENQKQLMTP